MSGSESQKLSAQLAKIKSELTVLRSTHQITVMELTESKEREEKLRKINTALMQSLETATVNLQPLGNIKVDLNGSFCSKRILQLERQLDQYRMGVNSSVDRRVRDIIKAYTQLSEEDKIKARPKSTDRTKVNINYNVRQTKDGQNYACNNCKQLQDLLDQKEAIIKQLQLELNEMKKLADMAEDKADSMEALIENLSRENNLLKIEIQRLDYQMGQESQELRIQYCDNPYQDNYGDRKSFSQTKQLQSECKDKQNKMIREINSLVSGLSNRKPFDDKAKSRVITAKNNSNLFSIKNGINRPNQIYY